MPSEVLDFDARGRMEVARGGAYIDTGEVKTSLDYAKGVEQLGIRLGVLRKMVEVCCHVPNQQVRLVGRLFVSKHGGDRVHVDELQRERALKEWDYSLYSHLI